jgi:putative transcriptional regulator
MTAVRNHTETLASSLEESIPEPMAMDLNDVYQSMIQDITDLPATRGKAIPEHRGSVELDGRQFTLPRSLERYASSTGNWSKLVGKLWQAPVHIGGMGKANFIYMEKGGSVPEHTHLGSELTLVINGAFSDGISDYDSGDFIAMNDNHTHAPHSNDNDGCLVFSVVQQPLHFTSGIARLLNPFSHLFFR